MSNRQPLRNISMLPFKNCLVEDRTLSSMLVVMPIAGFRPIPGTILICDYDLHHGPRNARRPEMIKRRPVIVLSGRDCQTGSCIVVPLSTTPPVPRRPYHHRIAAGTYSFLHATRDSWVKCDMLGVVGYYRLDRLRHGGRWITPQITATDLAHIRTQVQFVLGLSGLRAGN